MCAVTVMQLYLLSQAVQCTGLWIGLKHRTLLPLELYPFDYTVSSFQLVYSVKDGHMCVPRLGESSILDLGQSWTWLMRHAYPPHPIRIDQTGIVTKSSTINNHLRATRADNSTPRTR